jgi:hypothetical protein
MVFYIQFVVDLQLVFHRSFSQLAVAFQQQVVEELAQQVQDLHFHAQHLALLIELLSIQPHQYQIFCSSLVQQVF